MAATSPDAPPIPRSRWYRIGVLLFLCQLMGHIDRNNIGIAGPALAKEFDLSTTALGVLLSAFFWGYVAMQVPGGWLSSRYSAKRVLVVVLVVWGIAAAACGVVTDFSGLTAARAVVGIAEGALFPTIAVLIAKWFPSAEHGRATGLVILSLPLSSVIMSPIAGWLIQVWDYRVMFIAMAIPAIVLAIVVAVALSDSPRHDRWLSDAEREFLVSNVTHAAKEKASFAAVVKRPSILLLGLVYFLWQSGIYAFVLWLPSVIAQATTAKIGVVGVLAAIPFAVGAVGLYVNARRSDLSGRSRVGFIAVPLVIGGLALILQHFVSAHLWLNIAILCVCALGIYAPFGPWWAWVLRNAPGNQVGSVGGIVNAIGNFGGIVGPIVVGAAAGGGDLRNGFYVLGFALMAAAGIAVTLDLGLRRSNSVTVESTDTSTGGRVRESASHATGMSPTVATSGAVDRSQEEKP